MRIRACDSDPSVIQSKYGKSQVATVSNHSRGNFEIMRLLSLWNTLATLFHLKQLRASPNSHHLGWIVDAEKNKKSPHLIGKTHEVGQSSVESKSRCPQLSRLSDAADFYPVSMSYHPTRFYGKGHVDFGILRALFSGGTELVNPSSYLGALIIICTILTVFCLLLNTCWQIEVLGVIGAGTDDLRKKWKDSRNFEFSFISLLLSLWQETFVSAKHALEIAQKLKILDILRSLKILLFTLYLKGTIRPS